MPVAFVIWEKEYCYQKLDQDDSNTNVIEHFKFEPRFSVQIL